MPRDLYQTDNTRNTNLYCPQLQRKLRQDYCTMENLESGGHTLRNSEQLTNHLVSIWWDHIPRPYVWKCLTIFMLCLKITSWNEHMIQIFAGCCYNYTIKWCYHIEAKTKWLIFCREHCLIYFCWQCLVFLNLCKFQSNLSHRVWLTVR